MPKPVTKKPAAKKAAPKKEINPRDDETKAAKANEQDSYYPIAPWECFLNKAQAAELGIMVVDGGSPELPVYMPGEALPDSQYLIVPRQGIDLDALRAKLAKDA